MNEQERLTFCTFAAKNLLQQLNRLFKQMDGAKRAEDPECIHQMRVASRRLRSGLQVFKSCFPQNYKKWRNEIKKVTRELGTARDQDVQIIFLDNFIKNMDKEQDPKGVSRLLLRQKQKREKQQKQVNKAIENFRSSKIIDSITQSTRKIIGQSKLKKIPNQQTIYLPEISKLIGSQLADVLSYEDFIYDPDNIVQLHNLRKSCKRLRYMLEFFEKLYQSKLNTSITALKTLQTLLGDIHDCDVWNEYLPIFLNEEKERTLKYFGHKRPFSRIQRGIEFLRHNRNENRKEMYHQFIGEWEKLKQEIFWKNLENIFNSDKIIIQDLSQIEKKADKQLTKIKKEEVK